MPKERTNIEKFFWGLAIAGFLFGLFGLFDRLANGHLNAQYGSYIPWGLWVAGYVYMIGISAGAFIIAAMVYVFNIEKLKGIGKLALITALSSVLGAMVTVWMDIGHMGRAWRFVTNANFGSLMGWMFWFYSAYVILLFVMVWKAVQGEEKNAAILKKLGIIGIPLTIAFYGAEGAIFGVVGARPFWNSGLTPIIFLAGALLSGTAMVTFVTAMGSYINVSDKYRETLAFLGNLTFIMLLVYTLIEWAEFSIKMWNSVASVVSSEHLILFGPFWWVFWIIHLGLGVVIPLILFLGKNKSTGRILVASGLIAITFISVRLNIVIPALAVPELQGLVNAYSGPGLTFNYMPSIQEWSVFIWSVSAAALVFLVAKKYLPIVDIKAQNEGV